MTGRSWLFEDEHSSEKSSFLGMKLAAVSTVKPMLGASLPREPVGVALANAWRSSLALVRLIWALGEWALLGKLTERACSRGTGNGLEIFRMDIQWKTDSKS